MEVSTGEIATILGIGERQVQSLGKQGVLTKAKHGLWPVAASVQAYLRYRLESEAARASRTPADDRVRDARARQIELRIAKEQRDLIPTDEALGIVDEIIGIYRSSYGGLPARVTRDPLLRRKLEAEVETTQHRVVDSLEKRMREIGDAV